MCIRDRLYLGGGLAIFSVIYLNIGGTVPEHFLHVAAWRGAVSYTHLRAHETVLDLVCRLLLETQNAPVP